MAPLKLHHEAEPGAPKPEKKDLKRPVVKEKYEELVFHEPDEDFLKRVKSHKMTIDEVELEPANDHAIEHHSRHEWDVVGHCTQAFATNPAHSTQAKVYAGTTDKYAVDPRKAQYSLIEQPKSEREKDNHANK